MIKNKEKYLPSALHLRQEECFFNAREKSFVDTSTGELVVYERMVCSRKIFSDGSVELDDYTKRLQRWDAWQDFQNAEYNDWTAGYKSVFGVDYVAASKRRAKKKIEDYIICNDFKYFVTLTLDGSKIDRYNYDDVITRLKDFLSNKVKRHGLTYVGVTEKHKKGGLHFHFLTNGAGMKMVESGTYSAAELKKPCKESTLKKYKIPQSEWHTVYNVANWGLGFSTSIETYGSKAATANYVGKYITKNSEKVGGRWYFHGGKLRQPVLHYENVDFNSVDKFTYDFICDGGSFKVFKKEDLNYERTI